MLCGGSVNHLRSSFPALVARVAGVAMLVAVLALIWAAGSRAAGGNYSVEGGTAAQQAEVHAALDASTFDWSRVPHVSIHLAPGEESRAVPGQIWLDSDLLSSGRFAWAIVQHEYAHEVDFLLLSDTHRAKLDAALGGTEWYPGSGLEHAQYGCERFASTLAWAYWPSDANSLRPAGPDDESAAMEPARFRALMTQLLGLPNPDAPPAAFKSRRKPHRH
jgi:hypothetical protein